MSNRLTQEKIEQMVYQTLKEYGGSDLSDMGDLDFALGVLEDLSTGIEKTLTGPTKNAVETDLSSKHGQIVLQDVNEFLTSDYSGKTVDELKSIVEAMGSGSGSTTGAKRFRRDRMLKAVQYFYGSIEESDKNGPQGKKLRLLHIFLQLNAGQIQNSQLNDMSFTFLEQVLKPVNEISFEDIALNIRKIKTAGEFSKLKSDVFNKDAMKPILDTSDLAPELKTKTRIAFHSVLDDIFQGSPLKALKERVSKKDIANTSKVINMDDFFELFRTDLANNAAQNTNAELSGYRQTPNDLKLKLKQAYKKAMGLNYKKTYNLQNRNEGELMKKAVLSGIKSLIDAVDYYASDRKVRTKRGATTGWKIGTAKTSGSERSDQEVNSLMSKVGGGGATVAEKFNNFASFLDNVNSTLRGQGSLDGDISTLFSQFVGLEILNDNMNAVEEATVKGNLFEAFLASVVSGKQVGASRGAADFTYNQGGATIQGSAKFLNAMSFDQAVSGLKETLYINNEPFVHYICALKVSKTQSGQLRRAPETDKIRFVRIYSINVVKSTSGGSGDSKDDFMAMSADGSKNPNQSMGTVTGAGNSAVFKITEDAFVCELDFSFLEQTEFQDISTTILNQINKNVEKAFSSLTNLRDNITRWIDKKDIVAANQVDYNQKSLSDAIKGMKKDDELKSSELTENLMSLDNLIMEVMKEIKIKRKK